MISRKISNMKNLSNKKSNKRNCSLKKRQTLFKRRIKSIISKTISTTSENISSYFFKIYWKVSQLVNSKTTKSTNKLNKKKIVQTYTIRLTILKTNIIKIEINLRNKFLYNFYNDLYTFIIIIKNRILYCYFLKIYSGYSIYEYWKFNDNISKNRRIFALLAIRS